MGHDSENLVSMDGLQAFDGVILSPVNREPREMRAHIEKFREARPLDVIFDPQLYFPKVGRGKLIAHPYFGSNTDTMDLASPEWWQNTITSLVDHCSDLRVDALCSPVGLPSNDRWSDNYYAQAVSNYDALIAAIPDGSDLRPLMSVVVKWEQLDSRDEAMRVASLITRRRVPDAVYLIVEADVEPRRELGDDQRMAALMTLISVLEGASCRVLVSHCCSEMPMLKAAGASHCSTGKFFNLRRFTRSRFEEAEEGGGRQIPYWFEHGLLAFLREADIRRIWQIKDLRDVIGSHSSANGFGVDILNLLNSTQNLLPGEKRPAWLKLSWCQYLAWFAQTEQELSGTDRRQRVANWLKSADDRWGEIEDMELLLDERRNNGSWVRAWRQALAGFGGAS